MSSNPVLHFYQASSKYCEEYSSYRADTKSNSNTRRGDESKGKNAILVRNTSSPPVLHFYQIKIKMTQNVLELQKGHEERTQNQIQTQEEK